MIWPDAFTGIRLRRVSQTRKCLPNPSMPGDPPRGAEVRVIASRLRFAWRTTYRKLDSIVNDPCALLTLPAERFLASERLDVTIFSEPILKMCW